MDLNRRSFIRSAAVGGVLAASGEAFAVEPVRGSVTAAGKPMAGVVVSDGLNCVETGADGGFVLPSNPKARFISVTVPSGWKLPRHYLRYEGPDRRYDFALEPWAASKAGAFSFVHIGDSEINLKLMDVEKGWVGRTKELVAANGAAFVVHTGDISGQRMPAHAELMSETTVGCPVFYVVGNHDICGSPRGETVFEQNFGPCWYSFDAGGTHFIATPMMWGDGKPSYTVEEIVAWARNDLAIAAKKHQPVAILTHGGVDSRVWDLRRFFSSSSVTTESCEPFEATESCDLRAVIHGHIHRNYFMRSDDGRLALISAAPPNKNDASIQIVRVSEKGDFLRADYRFDLEHLWKPVETPPEGGWLTRVDGLVYNAVPAVSAGNVYICTTDWSGAGVPGVNALDAATGRRRWFFRTRGDVEAGVTCIGDRVFVNDCFWIVYALDAKTGREIWRFDARDEVGYTGARMWGGAPGFSGSAMTYDSATRRLYVGSARRALYALDPETGKVVWRTDAKTSCFIGSPTRPTVCGDVVVGWAYWAGTFAYDAKTGKELWEHVLGKAPTAAERHRMSVPWLNCVGYPACHNGRFAFVAHQHYAEADPKTGEIVRQKVFPFDVESYTSPLYHDGRIYFGTPTQGLVCIDEKTLELVWKSPVEYSTYAIQRYKYSPIRSACSIPVLWKGLVWLTAQDGALYGWDPKTGERRERIATGVPHLTSAVVAGDRLFTADFTGHVRCFR